MLVLAPISLAEDWSSPLSCEALGCGGTHGFDLIPFGYPILSGACCSTIFLCRRLACLFVMEGQTVSPWGLRLHHFLVHKIGLHLSAVELCVVEVQRVLNYFFFASVSSVLVDL